jgi:hypothetical protein
MTKALIMLTRQLHHFNALSTPLQCPFFASQPVPEEPEVLQAEVSSFSLLHERTQKSKKKKKEIENTVFFFFFAEFTLTDFVCLAVYFINSTFFQNFVQLHGKTFHCGNIN